MRPGTTSSAVALNDLLLEPLETMGGLLDLGKEYVLFRSDLLILLLDGGLCMERPLVVVVSIVV